MQGIKCRLWWLCMLVAVTPVCRFGDWLVATLRLRSRNKCHVHYQSPPHAQLLKEAYTIHWYHCYELLCSRKRPDIIAQDSYRWCKTGCMYLIVKMLLCGATLIIEFCCEKLVRYHLTLESHILRKQVTWAICISFNSSKAALCKILYFVWTHALVPDSHDCENQNSTNFWNPDLGLFRQNLWYRKW